MESDKPESARWESVMARYQAMLDEADDATVIGEHDALKKLESRNPLVFKAIWPRYQARYLTAILRSK